MNRAILVFSTAALLWLAMAAPLAAFTVNAGGTITDPATGLMWDRCSWGQTWDGTNACTGTANSQNWQAALGVAITANTANHRGYNDWRLPNRTELESLVDITKGTPPTINMTAFPNSPSGFFWSSTVYTPNPANAWVVNFNNGSTFAILQGNGYHVRLVRSGQSFDALAPAALGMITQPSSAAQSGVPFPQQPVVEVRDVNGDAVLAAGTDITAAIASGDSTLAGTTTVATDANGRATFTDLAISGTVGDRTLSFSAGSLTQATSGTITLSAGTATQMAINAGDNQSAVAGTAVATAPSVIVRDANDNPVEGVAVTFAVATGGGSVTGGTAQTNANGIATVGSWTLGTAVGPNTLTATSTGLTGSPLTFTATGTVGTATQMAIQDGQGQSATVDTTVAIAPSVLVTDANDNPVEGVAVTFAIATGGGSVTGASAATNASGIATVGSWTLGNTAGNNMLTASATGLSNVTFTATGTAGTATQMAINDGDGQSAVAGSAVAVAPSVLVTDANENPVEGVEVMFAVTSGGGIVDPTTPVITDADGVAVANLWILGTSGGTNTLTATVAGIPEPVTFTAIGIQVIPVPTLGTWALLMLLLMMFAMALPALRRRGGA